MRTGNCGKKWVSSRGGFLSSAEYPLIPTVRHLSLYDMSRYKIQTCFVTRQEAHHSNTIMVVAESGARLCSTMRRGSLWCDVGEHKLHLKHGHGKRAFCMRSLRNMNNPRQTGNCGQGPSSVRACTNQSRLRYTWQR